MSPSYQRSDDLLRATGTRLAHRPEFLQAGPVHRHAPLVVVGTLLGTLGAVTALLLTLFTGGARGPNPAEAALLQQPMALSVRQTVAVPAPADPTPAQQRAPAVAVAQPIGRWTPAIGVEIVRRALSWLGWPYSFAGGDAVGPTYGTPVDEASRNDGHIRGFDCSGLVLYALAPWLSVDHFASSQYLEAGTFHPRLDSLLPGDLVFWSPDDTIARIGHVAIYVGDGKVVQAPHSGARIEITPLYQVEAGYMGALRPLT